MVEECRFLLDTALGQSNVVDRWQWDPDPYDEYTVRGAYQTLTSMVTPTVEATDDLVWHKQVPLKAFIVSWRLLKDRLPTRLNLQRRGLLKWQQSRVFQVVATKNRLHVYFFIATFLFHYGSISGLGLECQE